MICSAHDFFMTLESFQVSIGRTFDMLLAADAGTKKCLDWIQVAVSEGFLVQAPICLEEGERWVLMV